ncbi:hypothetical protein D3X12_23640 [Pseudomonas protegens]|nr:hypothetical protein CEP86_32230 [Pseudomonas protegens]PNV94243.1 hypothetical protein C1633_30785 [Pseudomonas protegens]QEZ53432.1 hypothetical protein D3X12_23640 [Pseudomonas protegens]QEZ60356.1 hypothetical protein D4N38_28165 [Pseudomonas protegens]QEZ64720.1 hypothetical protein D4N37_18970 [Pseudomonas protegens]
MPAKRPASLVQTLRPPSRASPLLQNVAIGWGRIQSGRGIRRCSAHKNATPGCVLCDGWARVEAIQSGHQQPD